jgi:hypothetical protein
LFEEIISVRTRGGFLKGCRTFHDELPDPHEVRYVYASLRPLRPRFRAVSRLCSKQILHQLGPWPNAISRLTWPAVSTSGSTVVLHKQEPSLGRGVTSLTSGLVQGNGLRPSTEPRLNAVRSRTPPAFAGRSRSLPRDNDWTNAT